MSANLMERNGKVGMFCVGERESAWHKLGQRTPDAVKWEDAVTLADLNWTVEKRQLYARNPLGTVVSVPSYGTFRTDDGAYLGTVGEGYGIIQNREQFQWIDAILEAANGAHYESAGALGNGERIWCLARIPEADYEIDGGDKHQAYLMGCTSHDGSLAQTLKLVDTRVVCANTLAVALRESGSAVRVKHTVNAQARMQEAVRAVTSVVSSAKTIQAKMERLASTKLTRESTERILDILFPKSKDEKANQTRRENTVSDVLGLFASNDRNAFPSVKGTAYNLFNAVTEYADHMRTARGNGSQPGQVAMARAESALFGSGEKLKTQALEVILEHTSASLLESAIANGVRV